MHATRAACDDCPVRPHCSADRAGTVADRPLVRRRRSLPRVDYVTAVIVRTAASSPTALPPAPAPAPPTPPSPPAPPATSQPAAPTPHTLLTRRPDTGLLAGMWEFPTTEIHRHPAGAPAPASPPATTSPPTPATLTNAALQLLATLGLSGDPVAHPAPVKHTFSHFHATYHPVVVLCGADCADSPNTIWIDLARLDDFALPVAQQKIGARLTQRLTHRLPGSPC